MFTCFPSPITFNGNATVSPSAAVCTGLLTVWNCGIVRKESTIWNRASAVFCRSVNEFRVPVLRFEKALSAGANKVMPSDFLSRVLISASIWVLFRSPMKVVNLRAFLRIAVMCGGT
ncbi:unnamed protein product, partial [Vitis vinifera]|uniref:Uncharacterized protein n=1 Tax=Vitis vinifera TaxID=29760 RepID=D7TQJ6_VITVI